LQPKGAFLVVSGGLPVIWQFVFSGGIAAGQLLGLLLQVGIMTVAGCR
jgi:hypothetical protein